MKTHAKHESAAHVDHQSSAPARAVELQMTNNTSGAANLVLNRMQHFQGVADDSPRAVQLKRQAAKATGAAPADVQRMQKPNQTGLPDRLKSGIERLSGMSMDDVKVHYNSDKPAQLQAHAYAQANEIHVSPGQEQHLPHEAWHVVQQAQGRVRPTLQMKAGVVNDDPWLEKEADMMGEKAAQFNGDYDARHAVAEKREAAVTVQCVIGFSAPPSRNHSPPIQRRAYEAIVNRPTVAVIMHENGSIEMGTVYQELELGEYVQVNDEDKWRSSRDAKDGAATRWYRIQRLGLTNVSAQAIYVRDEHVDEAPEEVNAHVQHATALQQQYGDQVARNVRRLSQQLGVAYAPRNRQSVSHVIEYFAWLAKIGENLATVYADLNTVVKASVTLHASSPSEEELNMYSDAGILLDRTIVSALNRQLMAWTMVLTNDINDVIETFIDATGSPETMRLAIDGLSEGSIDLHKTLGNYLQLGYRAIEAALAKESTEWDEALKSALESVGGCYAAQAQAIERIEIGHDFDRSLEALSFTVRDLEVNGFAHDEIDIEVDNKASYEKLKEGDVIKSLYINPGFQYRIKAIDNDTFSLEAIH